MLSAHCTPQVGNKVQYVRVPASGGENEQQKKVLSTTASSAVTVKGVTPILPSTARTTTTTLGGALSPSSAVLKVQMPSQQQQRHLTPRTILPNSTGARQVSTGSRVRKQILFMCPELFCLILPSFLLFFSAGRRLGNV